MGGTQSLVLDGGTINSEYHPIFHGLTDQEIQEIENLTVKDHARNRKEMPGEW